MIHWKLSCQTSSIKNWINAESNKIEPSAAPNPGSVQSARKHRTAFDYAIIGNLYFDFGWMFKQNQHV